MFNHGVPDKRAKAKLMGRGETKVKEKEEFNSLNSPSYNNFCFDECVYGRRDLQAKRNIIVLFRIESRILRRLGALRHTFCISLQRL